MEIRRLIDAIFRRIWLIIILSIVGAMVAGVVSKLTAVTLYQSQASMYIMNKNKTVLAGESITYQDVLLSKQLIQDYGEIIKSRRVISSVVKELKIDGLTEDILKDYISVGLKKDSNVMIVSAVWSDPKTAAVIANSVSRNFSVKIKELTNNDSVGILDEAQPPLEPIHNGSGKKVAIGFAAGFLLALANIFIIEIFDNRIRYAEDITKKLGLKIMGIIPVNDIK